MPRRQPQACQTMRDLRVEIDSVDRELVELLTQRMAYIDRAAELKKIEALPARIPDRVEEVVANVRRVAEESGFDQELAEKVWRSLIEWSIQREIDAKIPAEESTLQTGKGVS